MCCGGDPYQTKGLLERNEYYPGEKAKIRWTHDNTHSGGRIEDFRAKLVLEYYGKSNRHAAVTGNLTIASAKAEGKF